jgi:hypothetical protein
MLWLSEHKRVWRLAVLGLLVVAILGPWTLDPIWVPAERQCHAPFIRMEGDFCGMPLSGAWLLWALVSEFISLVISLVTGAPVLTNWGRAFLFLLFALLSVLPFFSTLLLILAGDRLRRQVFNVAAWSLAAGIGLLMGMSSYPRLYWALWGIWLYIGLAAGALILEILTLAAGRKPSQEQ